MKKPIYYAVVIFLLTVVGIAGFTLYQRLKPPKIYDTSLLPEINVQGQDYKTTGALPTQDADRQNEFNQIIRLSGTKNANTSQFTISVSPYGEITITLNSPYEANKQEALKWLDENAFDKIDKSKINFVEAN